nr:hypothetical protein [Tanacetum cinerariifolium]
MAAATASNLASLIPCLLNCVKAQDIYVTPQNGPQRNIIFRGLNLLNMVKIWLGARLKFGGLQIKGVVESFNQSKMKHKVMYDDGDEDVLNLNQRQWTLLEDVPDELALPIKFLTPQPLAIKDSSTKALPKKVSSTHTLPKKGSSTQAPHEKVSSTQVPPEKVSSPLAPPKKGVCAQALPIKDFPTQTLPIKDLYQNGRNTVPGVSCRGEQNECVMASVALGCHPEKTETKEKCSLLMKGKASINLINKAANRDFEETRIELLTVQEKFKKAERCVEVLKLVEKKLHDSFLEESKAASDSWITQPVL